VGPIKAFVFLLFLVGSNLFDTWQVDSLLQSNEVFEMHPTEKHGGDSLKLSLAGKLRGTH